jgi:hypothetical protein
LKEEGFIFYDKGLILPHKLEYVALVAPIEKKEFLNFTVARYGNAEPSYGNAELSYGNAKPSYGNAKPSYGKVN